MKTIRARGYAVFDGRDYLRFGAWRGMLFRGLPRTCSRWGIFGLLALRRNTTIGNIIVIVSEHAEDYEFEAGRATSVWGYRSIRYTTAEDSAHWL